MEDQLSSMNQTIRSLQSVVMNSELFAKGTDMSGKARDKQAGKGKGKKLPFSNSQTTIYNSLLENQAEVEESDRVRLDTGIVMQEVDQEVSFKLRTNRNSSSSEDQVNTSDETINVDCDKFIADCEQEARGGFREGTLSGDNEPNPFNRGNDLTKAAEST